MLEARHLSKCYVPVRWNRRRCSKVRALDDVSLTLPTNSTFALVGESGAGKSTLARCLARLESADSGEICFEGKDLLSLGRQEMFTVHRSIQLVFQDSATAMNPLFSAAEIVEEPLRIQFKISKRARREQALAMMEQVGISPTRAERSPFELSGGQRQRLAIARALVLKPRLLILDEALSCLDLPTQAEMVKLLLELQSSLSLTYLFITHDLRLAAHMADEIAVMRQGRIVECSSVSKLFFDPVHSYTRSLLGAIPDMEKQVPKVAAASQ